VVHRGHDPLSYFTPKDASLNPTLEATPIRFGGRAAPSMWRAWLGFNISHVRPLAIAFSAVFLVLSLRFWFWGPVLITGAATTCFTVAAVLSI
jgi:hypothetical protein